MVLANTTGAFFSLWLSDILVFCPSSASMTEQSTFQDDEQMDFVFEEEVENQKSRRSVPAPTLQNLPLELHEHILLNAVVTEVMERRLVKRVWKEAADQVLERLKNVCPEWNYALKTKLFQDKLHAKLNSISAVDISLEVLANRRLASGVAVTSLNDDVFLLCQPLLLHPIISIYGRNNLNRLKGTIQLPEVSIPWNLVSCCVMNCLYLLHQVSGKIEIWRISKVEDQFEVSPWITCPTHLVSRISVAAGGCVILFQGPAPSAITIYNSDSSVKHRIELAEHIGLPYDIIPKTTGNFVLVARRIVEINREGSIVHERDTPVDRNLYWAVGMYDWMITVDGGGIVRLLDCEFNPMDVNLDLQSRGFNIHFYRMSYDRQRNEFLALETGAFGAARGGDGGSRLCLTIFNVKEKTTSKDSQNQTN